MENPNTVYTTREQSFQISRNISSTLGMTTEHSHNHYEIIYLLSGRRYFFIKDRTVVLNQGSLVCIMPSALHKTLDIDVLECERIAVTFSPSFLGSSSEPLREIFHTLFYDLIPIIDILPSEQSFVESLLFSMIREMAGAEIGYEIQIRSLLSQLLVFICRHTKKHGIGSLPPTDTMFHQASEIAQFITLHALELLTLDLVAQHFHISPSHLGRIFKKTTGFTFIEYLHRIRIEEARRLLRYTNLQSIDVAEKSGFTSISQFNRVFRDICGSSPIQYRKAQRSQGSS